MNLAETIPVDDPIRSSFKYKATERAIQRMLKDGTPDWVSHPNDYRNFVHEEFQREKEMSDFAVRNFRMEDEDILTDRKRRLVNIIHIREFLRRLHTNGVQCFTTYAGMPDTAGLWAVVPGYEQLGHLYICYVQIPYMCEWSVLKLDAHGLPAGEEYRGWRTALWRLIEEGVLTEQKAHQIFGEPCSDSIARRYRQSLYWLRNHANTKEKNECQISQN